MHEKQNEQVEDVLKREKENDVMFKRTGTVHSMIQGTQHLEECKRIKVHKTFRIEYSRVNEIQIKENKRKKIKK